jgi:hypothetical protein
VGLLGLASVSINPQGPVGISRYVLSFLQSDVVTTRISEFEPLSLQGSDGLLFALVILFLVFLHTKGKYRLKADQWLSLILFGTISLLARRNLIWFGFILTPIMARQLHDWHGRRETNYTGLPLLNGLFIFTFLILVGLSLPWFRSILPFSPERKELATPDTPFAATNFLCDTLPNNARVYAYQVYGGYQIWGCKRLPVFIDTRILQLYPTEIWEDYFAIEGARYDWEEVAAHYKITHLFLSLETQPWIVRAAKGSPHWIEIYRDNKAVIFQKQPP